MKVKIRLILLLISIITVLLLVTACETKTKETESTEKELIPFTLEELSKYNGKDGNPAYVAVDGYVYDVTHLRGWRNGTHQGFQAGNDLTDAIMNQSPHGVNILSRAKKIGILEE